MGSMLEDIAMKSESSLTYLLRCWQVETEEGPVWRASVESPYSGECYTFADLSDLLAFLRAQTEKTISLGTPEEGPAE